MPVIYPRDRAEQQEYAALLRAAGIRARLDTGAVPVFGLRIADTDVVPAGIPADRVHGPVIRFAPDPAAAPAEDLPAVKSPEQPAAEAETEAAPVDGGQDDKPPRRRAVSPTGDTGLPAADGDQADEPTPAAGEPTTEPSPTPSRKPQRRKGRN